MKIHFLFITLFFIITGCVTYPHHFTIDNTPFPVKTSYSNAIKDASVAEKGEISQTLIAITDNNKNLIWNSDHTLIRVVTWKSEDSYKKYLKPHTQTSLDEKNVVWVTTEPQVQNFCKNYLSKNPQASKGRIDLRLKQYLGLSPEWKYDVFVTMWVNPKDLFRPCVDPEIDDATCHLDFQNPKPEVKGIPDYTAFYQNLYYSDFRNGKGPPWTGLGYTYDWGNPLTKEGASEFILVPGAKYTIVKATPTMSYCNASGN